jgi:predicted CoA-binding protein
MKRSQKMRNYLRRMKTIAIVELSRESSPSKSPVKGLRL